LPHKKGNAKGCRSTKGAQELETKLLIQQVSTKQHKSLPHNIKGAQVLETKLVIQISKHQAKR